MFTGQVRFSLAVGVLLGLWPLLVPALSVESGQSPDAIADALLAEGATPEVLCEYADDLLAAGVAPGDSAEALLKAGCITQSVVANLLGIGGNASVVDVVTRVLYVQGGAVLDLVRTTAYAVPGIDKIIVDRAIAIYLGNSHLPIRDPGATQTGDLPDQPVSNL